jgi:hypothetical protein
MRMESPEKSSASPLPDRVHVWPYLVRAEFIAGCVVILGLLLWSIFFDAPLEALADAARTPNPSKAPWYFVGLQELLVYFDPWIAGMAIPTLIIAGLIVIPYLDTNPKGNGYYTLRERPIAVSIFVFGFLVWLGFIVVGVFLRGPGWNLYWPWEHWDARKVMEMTNVDLPELLGVHGAAGAFWLGAGLVSAWFLVPPLLFYWRFRNHPELQRIGRARFAIAAFLLLCMGGMVLKILLRLAFNVKYVWVWPNLFNV